MGSSNFRLTIATVCWLFQMYFWWCIYSILKVYDYEPIDFPIQTGTFDFPIQTGTSEVMETNAKVGVNTISEDEYVINPDVKYLLKVPFYVYEDMVNPDQLTWNGENIDTGIPIFYKKHTDDILMARAALKHPMRTLVPSEAKLFFVPTPLNVIMYHMIKRAEVCFRSRDTKTQFCGVDILDFAHEKLLNSTWFQRHQGKDHIMVASNGIWSHFDKFVEQNFPSIDRRRSHYSTTFFQCNRIVFEENKLTASRIELASLYVGTPCQVALEKHFDFSFVGTMTDPHPDFTGDKDRFTIRRNVCDWISGRNNTYNRTDVSTNVWNLTSPRRHRVGACGYGHQCPVLAQSKYGFHCRGGTLGSNRLMDNLLSLTVPIFTDSGQRKKLPPWIDWSILSELIVPTSREVFLDSLDTLLASEKMFHNKYEAVKRNRDIFDYHTLVPFDTYMYMFLISIWPDQYLPSHLNSNFDGLKIPDILVTPQEIALSYLSDWIGFLRIYLPDFSST